MPLRDKVVLITGATGPLGERLAGAFADAGAKLSLIVRRSSQMTPVEKRFARLSPPPLILPCDLRNEDEIVRMVHRTAQHYRRIDVVVNAATVVGPRSGVADYPADVWRDILATNVTGAYLVCREVLPWMTRQGAGSIINVAGRGAGKGHRATTANAVSAGGLAGFTQLLADELRGSGVRANLVQLEEPNGSAGHDAAAPAWMDSFLWLASDASALQSGACIRGDDFQRPS